MSGLGEPIRDYYGRIIGYVQTEPNGNKTVRDYYGVILGYYDKSLNVTQDFYKRIIARGDAAVGLIWQKYQEEEAKKKK